MTRWILPITGFTETASSPTGTERLWSDMRIHASSDLIVLTPRPWDDDMEGLAKFILRNSSGTPVVLVIGYSWGAGAGFIRFAEAAWEFGICIVCAVLADPVYRSRWLPTWLPFNPLSVLPIFRPSIVVPPSVRNVRWVRQDQSVPAGHDMVAEDAIRTHVEPGLLLSYDHTRIDESREFRALVSGAVDEFLHIQ